MMKISNNKQLKYLNITIDNEVISTYTICKIIKEIRDEFGLEASVEFIDDYLDIVNFRNPELKDVVCLLIKEIDLIDLMKSLKK